MIEIREVPIKDIRIGERFRKGVGDFISLGESIADYELLQPIGVTAELELVFGLRRLLACQYCLGWTIIPARLVPIASIALGEIVENEMRKEWTPSEKVGIVDALKGYRHGGDRKSDQGRICDVDRLSVEAAAAKLRWTRDDYFRAKRVIEKGSPQLVQAMDEELISLSAAAKIADAPAQDLDEAIVRCKNEKRWVANAAEKRLRRIKRNRERQEATTRRSVLMPAREEDIRLYHCRFQELGVRPSNRVK